MAIGTKTVIVLRVGTVLLEADSDVSIRADAELLLEAKGGEVPGADRETNVELLLEAGERLFDADSKRLLEVAIGEPLEVDTRALLAADDELLFADTGVPLVTPIIVSKGAGVIVNPTPVGTVNVVIPENGTPMRSPITTSARSIPLAGIVVVNALSMDAIGTNTVIVPVPNDNTLLGTANELREVDRGPLLVVIEDEGLAVADVVGFVTPTIVSNSAGVIIKPTPVGTVNVVVPLNGIPIRSPIMTSAGLVPLAGIVVVKALSVDAIGTKIVRVLVAVADVVLVVGREDNTPFKVGVTVEFEPLPKSELLPNGDEVEAGGEFVKGVVVAGTDEIGPVPVGIMVVVAVTVVVTKVGALIIVMLGQLLILITVLAVANVLTQTG